MPANDNFEDFESGDELTAEEAELIANFRAMHAGIEPEGDEDYDDPEEVEAAVPAPAPQPNRAARRSAGKIPASAPKPQDRQRRKAAEVEATSDTLEFEFHGNVYTAPIAGRTKGLIAASDSKSVSRMIMAILGVEQYRAFLGTDPYDEDYSDLFQTWAKAAGFEGAGN